MPIREMSVEGAVNAIFHWLQTISATAFVGILAFIGTVLTVVLSNRAASDRLRRQFVEERRGEEKTRLFESRREVYLEAAEALIVAMMCVGRLADLNRTAADIVRPYEEHVGNIAKIHLLANEVLGALVVEIVSQITSAILELSLGRVPLETRWREAKGLESRAAEDPKVREQAQALWRGLLPDQLQFAEECARRASTLAPIIGNAVLAIRKDLDMPGYIPNFPELLENTAAKQIDQLKAAFRRLED